MFKAKNIMTGLLYFYVHFITEIICFFCLSKIFGDRPLLWLVPFMYDFLAFVPQSIIGYISDKHPKFKPGLTGVIITILGLLSYYVVTNFYLSIALIAIGNAFIHVSGAEVTLRTSGGKMAHSAIFVSGGSFGVVTGKLLAKTWFSYWMLIPFALTMIPFMIKADQYQKEECNNFNYNNPKVPKMLLIVIATLVVIIRGYMGYGIPISWNKTTIQLVMLFAFMGIGKALGGILIDKIGMRKTALISTIGAYPLLIFGENIMVISLIGVMFFSMTMAITLGLLVSVLKKKPGLAFGFTTIGLFLGTAPTFFYAVYDNKINILIVSIATLICIPLLMYTIRKDEKHGTN